MSKKHRTTQVYQPPRRTVLAPDTDEAPVYWECPVCGFLTADPSFLDHAHPCPKCDAQGMERRVYPTERIRRLDARIRQYNREGDHEIVVILVMALLEAVLEDILDRIMDAHGADLPLRRMVMDTQRAIGTRIGKLFPALAGEEFEDAAAELGYRDFPYRWRQMREARNAFIHDSPFNGAKESLQPSMGNDAMQLLDQSYQLFVLLNNRFVADGYHGK
jgi:rubredoxin